LLASIVNNSYSLYLRGHNQRNPVGFNVYTLVETISLYTFFYLAFPYKKVKTVILFLASFFIAFWSYRFIKTDKGAFLDSCAILEYVSILILAVYYFYDSIIKRNSIFIYRQARFWIISAYLIYIAGTFFLLLYLPSMGEEDRQKYYDILNSLFTIIRTILLSIAMFMKTNNPTRQKFKLT
jgi:hypothetical protein